MKKLIIGLLLLSTTGCAWLESHPEAASIVVQYATARYITTDTGDRTQGEKAQGVLDVVAAARPTDDPSYSLAALRVRVDDAIPYADMNPADATAARALVNLVIIELRNRYEEEIEATTVTQVLDWITIAAEAYVE